MYPYITILILIAGISFLKKENRYFKLILIILFFFSASRGNGDGDYFAYREFSTYIKTTKDIFNFNFPIEIGFRIISFYVNKFNLSSQIVIVIMNLISLLSVGFFINSNSKYKVFSILIFYFYFLQYDMHAARAGVAISLGCLSINYLFKDKKIKSLIFYLLAISFHTTALILFVVYILKYIKINIYTGIMWIIIFILIQNIIDINFILFKILEVLNMESISKRLYIYMQSKEYGYPFRLVDPRLIVNILTYILIEKIIKKIENIELKKKYRYLNRVLWFGILSMIILSKNTALVTRISSYFTVITVVLIPNIVFFIKELKISKKIYYIYDFGFKFIYIFICLKLSTILFEYKLFFNI